MVRAFAVRLALIVMGAGLGLCGLLLLLHAAWTAIAVALGAIWASALLGGALLLVGATVVFVVQRKRPAAAISDTDLVALLTKAFLQGLAAGRSARRPSGAAGE